MIRFHAFLAVVASFLCLPVLHGADEPYAMGLALRSGYTLTSQDKLNPFCAGLGLTLAHPLGAAFTWRAELAYLYKPGRQYLAPIQPAAQGRQPADPNLSADLRKNQLDAVVLRLSGAWTLDSDWALQGGLQMGKTRFSQQVVGQTGDTQGNYLDTFNSTPVKSVLAVSPFLGIQYQIDKDSLAEVDLLGLAYTAVDFLHTPGSKLASGSLTTPGSALVYQGDHLQQTSRMTPTVEISYRFRF